MTGKKAMLCLTLDGREHMFGDKSIHGYIETYLSSIQRGSLAYVGFEVLPPFIAYHVPYIKDEDRMNIIENFEDYLNNIDQFTPLEFPKLENFDEKLYPF